MRLSFLLLAFSPALFDQGAYEEVRRVMTEALGRYEDNAGVLYNLACFYAIEGKEEELAQAVELLERTQTHRYAQEIHASWVQRDPDLEWLRQSSTDTDVGARYQAFIALLKGEDWPPEERADGRQPRSGN